MFLALMGCQALGDSSKGKPVRSLKEGAAFSFRDIIFDIDARNSIAFLSPGCEYIKPVTANR